MRRTEGCAQMRTSYLKFLQDFFTNLVPLVLNKIAHSVYAVISNDVIKGQWWCHLRAGPERSRNLKETLLEKDAWDNLCGVSKKHFFARSSFTLILF